MTFNIWGSTQHYVIERELETTCTYPFFGWEGDPEGEVGEREERLEEEGGVEHQPVGCNSIDILGTT